MHAMSGFTKIDDSYGREESSWCTGAPASFRSVSNEWMHCRTSHIRSLTSSYVHCLSSQSEVALERD